MSKTPFSKIQHWAQYSKRKLKYNLHYGEVQGEVMRPPHGTNTRGSEVKKNPKGCLWKQSIHNR